MTTPRFSLQQLVGNIKFVGTLAVLVLAISTVALSKTPETGAFLASGLRNIRMGVGTDEWQPPKAPQILGFGLVAEVDGELTSCGKVTDTSTVSLHWQDADEQVTQVESFWVGTVAEPEQTQVAAGEFVTNLTLQEGINAFVVTAVDERGELSQPAESCRITLDTVSPEVTILQPTVSRAGQDVEIEAAITENNLDAATIMITNEAGEVVSAGEMTTTESSTDSAESTHTIATNWQAQTVASGTYQIKVVAKDQANHQAEQTIEIIIDHQAPTSALTMKAAGQGSAGQSATNQDTNLLKNPGLEAGLTDWEIQGDVQLSGLSGSATKPWEGSLVGVLGRSNNSDQVSFLSQDLSAVAGQVKTIGFWYYLNPVAAGAVNTTPTEGMAVFAGEQMVYQQKLSANDAQVGWQYLELDVAAAADPSVTIAYYHDNDSSTGGELYLDGFSVNRSLEIKDITFEVTAQNSTQTVDASDQATAFVAYTTAGNEVITSQPNSLSVTLPTMPDDKQIKYWAVDSVGNREQIRTATVPTITKVSVTANTDQPSNPTDQPSSDVPASDSATPAFSATLQDLGDYQFKLNLENADANDVVDFTIIYRHSDAPENVSAESGVQEAVQGQVTVGNNATEASVDGLYFGTCSSTAGEVCTPHLNVHDILVQLLVTGSNASTAEYEVRYPGLWTTTISENNNASI